jgi:hypothetical protein
MYYVSRDTVYLSLRVHRHVEGHPIADKACIPMSISQTLHLMLHRVNSRRTKSAWCGVVWCCGVVRCDVVWWCDVV